MRKSGILMHITSLPSPYGIGTMGKSAYAFVDFLKKSGQQSWQLLPLTPTGYGDSPYQSCSAYAGNPYLIDLDMLIGEGLLTKADLRGIKWGDDATAVDFGAQYNNRYTVLRKAYERFRGGEEFDRFLHENESWLPDFSLYMALKADHNFQPWFQWEAPLKFRDDAALGDAWNRLEDTVYFYSFQQFEFYKQWNALRAYANNLGIELIGDVPIYVPYDSVEVWKNPELFQLDKSLVPTAVAGCPPDSFSADGQLWGNPLYRWDVMQRQGFRWWIERMSAAGKLFDVVRLDHFRGFESYWAVPYGDKTAKNGKWVPGPRMAFVNALKQNLPDMDFIAEDLGFLTPEVLQLRDDSGYPGMKILLFAFDPKDPSDYLPHTYIPNTVCYTGTHDNVTAKQWFTEASRKELAYAREYMHIAAGEDDVWGLIRTAMASVSTRAIVQMQDYLGLGAEARMNTPGKPSGNWAWRAPKGYLTAALSKKILAVSRLYDRAPRTPEAAEETK